MNGDKKILKAQAEIPILLLTYRRPETTRQVLAALRRVKPQRVFFAADAANPGEIELCKQVRALVTEIDWPCEITTRFREENRGLRDAVNSSVDWFFSEVDAGIILEDDCVPGVDFFSYCAELLDRYRDEPRVAQISGTNHDRSTLDNSFRFSRYPHIWGWATWADRWQKARASEINRAQLFERIEENFSNRSERKFWKLLYHCIEAEKFDTWDFSWLFSMFKNDWLSITPARNLITNVGFGEGATHTTGSESPHGNRASESLEFPLIHPTEIKADPIRDREVATDLYGVDRSARLLHAKLHLTRLLPTNAKRRLKKLLSSFNSE